MSAGGARRLPMPQQSHPRLLRQKKSRRPPLSRPCSRGTSSPPVSRLVRRMYTTVKKNYLLPVRKNRIQRAQRRRRRRRRARRSRRQLSNRTRISSVHVRRVFVFNRILSLASARIVMRGIVTIIVADRSRFTTTAAASVTTHPLRAPNPNPSQNHSPNPTPGPTSSTRPGPLPRPTPSRLSKTRQTTAPTSPTTTSGSSARTMLRSAKRRRRRDERRRRRGGRRRRRSASGKRRMTGGRWTRERRRTRERRMASRVAITRRVRRVRSVWTLDLVRWAEAVRRGRGVCQRRRVRG
ncbi:hypothetical protein IWZ03DRAFT_420690, partial [Phyllosticta citriasiana]